VLSVLPAATRKSKTKVSRFMLHVYVGRATCDWLVVQAANVLYPGRALLADGPRHRAPRRPSGPTESAKEPNKHTLEHTTIAKFRT
jgi:hypothetical protein